MGYAIGQEVTLECRFTRDGAPLDPAAVTCTVERPDGVELAASTVQVEPGLWAANVTTTMAGRWRYRFAGTDPVAAADERSFLVERSFVDTLNP